MFLDILTFVKVISYLFVTFPKLPDFKGRDPALRIPVTLNKRKFNLVIIYRDLNLDRSRHVGSEIHCLCEQLTLIKNIIIMRNRIYVHNVFNLGSQKL